MKQGKNCTQENRDQEIAHRKSQFFCGIENPLPLFLSPNNENSREEGRLRDVMLVLRA